MKPAGDTLIADMPAASLGSPPWSAPPRIPPRTLPGKCEVLIVGAGLTGLAAAMWLARRGAEVIVIDRAFGSGASARSGGVILGDTLVGAVPDFDDCHVELRQWILDEWVDCDLFWCGCLELARDVSLPREPIDWQAEGSVRQAGSIAGGVLNPAKLQLALADAARRAGAILVDEVSVVAVSPDGSRVPVATDRGEIAARRVVMAVDATGRTLAFDPWSERVMTVALQTSVLSAEALAAIGLKLHQAFYTRDLPLLWGRVMPDRSLLIGRETFEFVRSAPDRLSERFEAATARLTARVHALHPELRETKVCRAWAGPIARSSDGVPALVVDPRNRSVFWAGGYGGHGVAQSFRLGRLVAQQLSS